MSRFGRSFPIKPHLAPPIVSAAVTPSDGSYQSIPIVSITFAPLSILAGFAFLVGSILDTDKVPQNQQPVMGYSNPLSSGFVWQANQILDSDITPVNTSTTLGYNNPDINAKIIQLLSILDSNEEPNSTSGLNSFGYNYPPSSLGGIVWQSYLNNDPIPTSTTPWLSNIGYDYPVELNPGFVWLAKPIREDEYVNRSTSVKPNVYGRYIPWLPAGPKDIDPNPPTVLPLYNVKGYEYPQSLNSGFIWQATKQPDPLFDDGNYVSHQVLTIFGYNNPDMSSRITNLGSILDADITPQPILVIYNPRNQYPDGGSVWNPYIDKDQGPDTFTYGKMSTSLGYENPLKSGLIWGLLSPKQAPDLTGTFPSIIRFYPFRPYDGTFIGLKGSRGSDPLSSLLSRATIVFNDTPVGFRSGWVWQAKKVIDIPVQPPKLSKTLVVSPISISPKHILYWAGQSIKFVVPVPTECIPKPLVVIPQHMPSRGFVWGNNTVIKTDKGNLSLSISYSPHRELTQKRHSFVWQSRSPKDSQKLSATYIVNRVGSFYLHSGYTFLSHTIAVPDALNSSVFPVYRVSGTPIPNIFIWLAPRIMTQETQPTRDVDWCIMNMSLGWSYALGSSTYCFGPVTLGWNISGVEI